ncbi:hypothetical protein ACWDYH_10000 [Nocardia goodfellowii]|uniref:Aminoglycoside phosphotransferase (APT) family kinase protein n=1 Tax=Nocardia goodfellowii TaxID=882446 RepID=A0ABS4QE65_9NOCA|nr:hypothetical protein [Nocardia goodfellowii]MBP2189957.1 aminoglycoside phosphotransferase (APT) family kinase protein [Nocardia goodfellowii]
MHTTRKSAARRTLARVAIAGVLTAIPLTALAVPASATPAVPNVTEVRHGDDCHRHRPWDHNSWDDRRHDRWDDDWDNCERRRKPHDPFNGFGHHRPPGLFFGSS